MLKRLEIIASGRVQGVGFRFFLASNANTLNLTGFCKNLEDGTVYIEVQGSEKLLESFIEKIELGNRFIRVTNLDKKVIPLVLNEKKFNMVY
ncbi:acylphosphatase [Clostridium chrysemydis]|uniref:acylphosphatase n=1 Tax=Clostridium chrysemydis TaxID=2665504 RepID=UPI003B75CEE1